MRFATEMHAGDAAQAIEECVALAGRGAWDKAAEWLGEQFKRNSYLRPFLLDRYPIELAYAVYRVHQFHPETLPEEIFENAFRRIGIFSKAVVEIHKELKSYGRKQLEGRLFQGLTSEDGLASLDHELATAVHLMTRGYDVEFSDLEGGGGFDFLGTREGLGLEVECKLVSGDAGHHVHRWKAVELISKLIPIALESHKEFVGGVCYRIIVEKKLSIRTEEVIELCSALRGAIFSNLATYSCSCCTISKAYFDVKRSPFVRGATQTDVSEYAKTNLGIGNEHFCFVVNDEHCVVISVESEQPSKMLESVFKTVRKASRQCTTTRPAIICAKFYDLSPDALREIGEQDKKSDAKPSALRVAVSDFLHRHAKPHLHSCAFWSRSEGERYQFATGYVLYNSH